ncbi:MAG: hypothetical protein M3173_05755 [Chloroflexota bacterium]|nr:hypothetical protein [Chloroflexota bacterium]
MTLLVHIAAGGLAIAAGYVALLAAKGARLHRQSGILFVYSMVTMAVVGAGMAAVHAQPGNVIAGLLATYLVVTALTTVRPSTAASRRLDAGAMLVALAVGLTGVTLGLHTLVVGDGTLDEAPAAVFLIFGAVALLSCASDLRMMRSGGLRGAPRLARHLWRMCFALFIAAGSFFLGQADEIPEWLRILPLLAIPAFLPLLVMVYWLWRIRIRQPFRRIPGVSAPEVHVPGAVHRHRIVLPRTAK